MITAIYLIIEIIFAISITVKKNNLLHISILSIFWPITLIILICRGFYRILKSVYP